MVSTQQLSLSDYSLKYKVSISTLRRRIKNQEVDFVLQEGKYLLADLPPEQLKREPPVSSRQVIRSNEPPQTHHPVGHGSADRADIHIVLAELKSAYALIQQEKDQLILQLKEEISDLKTLVQVLEHENDRLKTVIKDTSSIDEWLKTTGSEI